MKIHLLFLILRNLAQRNVIAPITQPFQKWKLSFLPLQINMEIKIITEKYLFKSCNDIVDTFNMSIPTILCFDMSDNFINIFST